MTVTPNQPRPVIVLAAAMVLGIIMAELAHARGIDELNAQRAHMGLPPCVEDPQLTAIAQKKAEIQAAHLVNLKNGYNGHEPKGTGGYGVSGLVEGTGCLPARWGWATCAMRVSGSPRVGCGIAIGSDGNRYMCLVIAASKITEGGYDRPVINTSHMTPDAPRIPHCTRCRIQRNPIGRWH